MAKTKTFTVDAVNPMEQIVPSTACTRIVVYENNQAGTVDYVIAAPTSTDQQLTRPAGAKTEFTPRTGQYFRPGTIVAYIATATGSATFAQEEH